MTDYSTSLEQQNSRLRNETGALRSEVAYLKGKIEAYERFLKMQGFIEGGEDD